jgi:hypothetical protein
MQKTVSNVSTGMRVASLSVLVLLHQKIGIDVVSKSELAFMSGLMLLMSAFSNIHVRFSLFGGIQVMHDHDNSLFYYLLLALGLGIWHRMHWQRDEALGIEPHSFSRGDGRWYGFIPLGRKHIDLWVTPAVVFIAGAVARYRLHFGLLGLWFMGSAIALCITEKMWQVKMQEFIRMHKNIGKEGQWWADYERTRPKGTPPKDDSASSSATIPTGSDETLDELIEKNKRDNSFLN